MRPELLAGRLHDLGPLLRRDAPRSAERRTTERSSRDRDDARDAGLHGLLEGVIHAFAGEIPWARVEIEWRFALGGAMTPTRTLTLPDPVGWARVGAVHRLRPCSADKVGDVHATPWLDRSWTDAGV